MRITNVAPGLVETDFSKVRFQRRRGEGGGRLRRTSRWAARCTPEDVADCIMFALTRPPNVNIDEIVVIALAQTSGANILRET